MNFLRSAAIVVWYVGWLLAIIPAGIWALEHEKTWWSVVIFTACYVVVLGMVSGFIPKYILVPLWKHYWWAGALAVLAVLIFGFDPFFDFVASFTGTARVVLVVCVGSAYIAAVFGIIFVLVRALLFSQPSGKQRNK